MGMFSSLFGSSGSDKADKLRREAVAAFDAIQTPALSALQVQLDKYVQAGTLTPMPLMTSKQTPLLLEHRSKLFSNFSKLLMKVD
jgi:hypothetical protein